MLGSGGRSRVAGALVLAVLGLVAALPGRHVLTRLGTHTDSSSQDIVVSSAGFLLVAFALLTLAAMALAGLRRPTPRVLLTAGLLTAATLPYDVWLRPGWLPSLALAAGGVVVASRLV